MLRRNKQVEPNTQGVSFNIKSYGEIVEFLDANWSPAQAGRDATLIKKLDAAFGSPSKDLKTILINGSNGKSLTIHFATQLLRQDGVTVGSFTSPHILTYNERFTLNNELISNKVFTELANEVITTAQSLEIQVDTLEILTMMAILYFKRNNVDVAFFEINHHIAFNPATICKPNIVGITRITHEATPGNALSLQDIIAQFVSIAGPGTFVASADQSKHNLQLIQDAALARGAEWTMPIRKLAPLSYPFEQLHGRCAALAERICQTYIDNFTPENAVVVANSLLVKQKGQRGRPTLEAKRHSELHPKRTVDQFWRETTSSLPGNFQLLDKEKPTILLDTASNTDALENLLLGIRLLHYQRSLQGLAFVFGCDKNQMQTEEFLKLLRYFSKKHSCTIILCPINTNIPGIDEESWDVDQVTNDVKSLKIKTKSYDNFEQALETAEQAVDEKYGLVVVTGSKSIVAQYWKHKGIKKL